MFISKTLTLLILSFTAVVPAFQNETKVDRLEIEILKSYPHDTSAFTQGLIWYSGHLYESTGRYGSSSLRKIRLKDGVIRKKVLLKNRFFGEGLTRVGNRLIQLTWRAGIAFVYDLKSLELINRVTYSGEGWGLTYDGSWLVMSDGSDTLTFRDPVSFAVWRRLPVRLQGQPVESLNELEFAKGWIYANIWTRSEIMKIDPRSGRVAAVIDATQLPHQPRMYGEDVLNGIAYLPESDTFLLTGKLWPKIYEVRFE